VRALRAELLKLLTTRLLLWYAGGLAAFLVLVLSIHIGSDDRADLGRLSTQHGIFTVAGLAAVVAVLLGSVIVTAEYAHGTINQSLLAVPARERLLAGKLGAALIAVFVVAVLADAVTLLLAELWFAGRGITLHIGGDTLAPLLGAVGASLLAGAVGVGLGAVLRRQTGAIVVILLWLLIGEAVIGGIGGDAAYAPGHALGAVAIAHLHGAHDRLSLWGAVATGAFYAVLFCAVGLLVLRGSDVPSSGD
jgi:ABC-type transport system involved in multi-copper enzyme maturation permease subunit